MSSNITFEQFNSQKIDAFWEAYFTNSINIWVAEQHEALQRKLEVLKNGKQVPKDDFEEIRLSYQNPVLHRQLCEVSWKIKKIEEKMDAIDLIEKQVENISILQKNGNTKSINEVVREIDQTVVLFMCEKSFNEDYFLYANIFDIIFQKIIGKKFTDFADISLISQDVWTKVFSNLSDELINEVAKKSKWESDLTPDDFLELLQEVKDVLKYCVDTNSIMVAVTDYDGAEAGFYSQRADVILKRIVQNFIT